MPKMKKLNLNFCLALGLLLLALGYQNCGWEMESPSADSSSSSGSLFAYSATVDRIAYMGCSDNNTNTEFFTFRAGAFDTNRAGVKLTPEIQKLLTGKTTTRKIEILNEQEYNRDAQLQLALRPFDDLAAAITVNGIAVFKNILTPLNLSPIAPDLVALAANTYLPDSKYSMKGNLQFGQANDNGLRDYLSQKSAILTLTYLKKDQQYISRDIEGKVPGQGYHVRFDCGMSNKHVLCSVQEYDLYKKQPVGSWDCPAAYQFRIIRDGEAGNAGCNAFGAVPSAASSDYAIYNEVRRILGNNWHIDMYNRCVMPSSGIGSCYGSQTIDYSLSGSCDQPGQAACVRHLSVCLKGI
jgi:hypothetical protein